MARRRSSSKRSSPRAALIRSLRRSAELSMAFSDERDNLDELSLKQLRSLSKKLRNPRRTKRNCGRNPYREDTYYADREIRKVKKSKRSKRKKSKASKRGMRAVLGRMNPRGKGRLRTTGIAGGKYMRYLERTTHKPKARKGRPSFKGGNRGEFRASRAQHRRADLVWAGRHESIRKRSYRSKNPRSARPGENDIPTVVIVRKGKGSRNPPITPKQAAAIKAVLRRHGY